MRLALIGYLHGRGGIQTHTAALAEALAARGHAVRALSPPEMPGHPGPLAAPRGVEVSVYRPREACTGFGLRGWADAAVVCGTGHAAMLGALRSGPGCRKVFFEVMSGAGRGWRDPRWLVHAGFDAVIGQARPVEARFRAAFGWRGPSATIPALAAPLNVPDRPPARALARPLRMAYFGRLAAHKNVAHLVETWDRSRHDTLDIWGGGAPSEEAALREAIARAGPGARIALRGAYPAGDAHLRLLSRYDMILLPTVGDEGAPLVLLEAMACGVPFAANGVGGIPDYANPDCAVTNGEIAAFASAARRLAERVRAGQVCRARLQRLYRRRYAPGRLAERWEAMLAGLVAGRPPCAEPARGTRRATSTP